MKSLWVLAGRVAFWISWPGIFIFVFWSRRTRVIVESGDKVLLVKGWLASGKWQLPGGGIHGLENATAGAVREVKEETGLVLDPRKLVLMKEGRASENAQPFYLFAYRYKIGHRQTLKPHRLELVDAKWFTVDEIIRKNDVTQLTKQLLRVI